MSFDGVIGEMPDVLWHVRSQRKERKQRYEFAEKDRIKDRGRSEGDPR